MGKSTHMQMINFVDNFMLLLPSLTRVELIS